MSEVTRYNKLQLDNIQYDKPEEQRHRLLWFYVI